MLTELFHIEDRTIAVVVHNYNEREHLKALGYEIENSDSLSIFYA